jgi:regulator of sigma E protease
MELLNNLLHYLLPFVFTLTIVVFVHEFGHFLVARINGVKVEVFSIGFGKEIFGFTDTHNTRWKFCLIPMGGYVKMFGDKGSASKSDNDLIATLSKEDQKIAFPCQSLLSKASIVIAGPAANYLFSALIFTIFFAIYGAPFALPKVSEILHNSPAEKAGIEINDSITEINGQTIQSFNEISKIMALSTGEEINLTIKRSETLIEKKIVPMQLNEKDILGNDIKSYKLGIMADHVALQQLSIFGAAKRAVIECYQLSAMSLKAMGQMLMGKRSAKELGGPIKIAQYSAKSAEHGFQSLLWFMALLSVNLGLINLLPIPVLDGGHLLIYFTEFTFGKKIATKLQDFGFQIGIILLIMLTIYTTFNDLSRLNLFKG